MNKRKRKPPRPVKRNRKRQEKRRRARNGCGGKKRYEYDRALYAAARVIRNSHRRRMAVYLCEHCGNYHVSHHIGKRGQVALVEVDEYDDTQ